MEVRARGYSFNQEGFSNLVSGDGLLGGLLKVGWHDVFYLKHVEGENKITIKYYALNNLRSLTKSVKVSNFVVKMEHVPQILDIAKKHIPDVSVETRPRKYSEAANLFIFLSVLIIIGCVCGAFVTPYTLPFLIGGVALVVIINIIGIITFDKNRQITVFKTGGKPTFIRTRF